MPRPRSFTPSGIAAAALTVIDREGLDALTMRSVASALGLGTMSLYRYVEGREALESLVVDTVMRGIELPAPSSSAKWTTRVMGLMTRVREAVVQHPAVAPLLLTRRHSTTGTLAWAEALLGLLTEGGFDGTARVIAFRALVSYVFGAVQLTHLGSLSGEGTAALAELDVATYPLLRETARRAQRMTHEEEFRHGLELILRGVEETVAHR